MPLYLYLDERDGSVHEVVQTMKEEHRAFAKDGYELKRIFINPNASIDSKWDENSSKDFIEKTGRKRGTVGDLFDKSKELSLKREQKEGCDPIKEKMYNDYSKKRDGATHPQQRKEKFEKKKKELVKKGFDISV